MTGSDDTVDAYVSASLRPYLLAALIGGEDAEYRDWYIFEDEDPGYTGPWGQHVWHPTPGGDDYYYGIFVDSMPDLDFENPAVNDEVRRITAYWLEEMGVDGFRIDVAPGRYTPVEMAGLYWHFVDIVWIFLFPLLYLV